MNAVLEKADCLPLLVLTGFLGSGKTTLLNRMLCDPALHDTAVVVNEFGAVGLDHLLVAPVADDVILLASGCVCCSAGDDLSAALTSLLQRRQGGALPPFRRIVLETTGIADPPSLLQRILSDPNLAAQIRIHAVVTVVDAIFGQQALRRYNECASQVAVATRLIISKLDLAGPGALGSLLECLRSINPTAPILTPAHHGPVPDSLFDHPNENDGITFDATLPCRLLGTCVVPADHASHYQTFGLDWNEPIHWQDFKAWIEGLLISRGENILRLKGLLQIAGCTQPVVVQAVQHALYPPKQLTSWPNETPRSHLVFVTRHFPRAAAVRSFAQFFPYCVFG